MVAINVNEYDRSLALVDKTIEEAEEKKTNRRGYLGMSQIGEPCWRKLFYSFRLVKKRKITASGLKAIEDGYTQEDVMARRLRAVPGIELYTVDPENPTKQIEFKMINGHLGGHCDGIIRGLVEAPETWHVWEHKSVNVDKFNKLKKLREEIGEKESLEKWDEIYYAQAQTYMHNAKLSRHFLTVSTPGGRDRISVRTEYKEVAANVLIHKAASIIFENVLPPKISDRSEFYLCKWCDYTQICHFDDKPALTCRSCASWQPVADAGNFCVTKGVLCNDLLWDGCPDYVLSHVFIPGGKFATKKPKKELEPENNRDKRLRG